MSSEKAPGKSSKKTSRKVTGKVTGKVAKESANTSSSDSAGTGAIELGLLSNLIGYHLHRAEIASYRLFVNSFHHPKYTPKQFSVLMLAKANPGISQIAIGSALGMDRATTMAVIDKMQARKLLTRDRSKQDRRKQEILLTEKGLELTQRLMAFVKEHDARISSGLTAVEAKALSSLLIKVRTALES